MNGQSSVHITFRSAAVLAAASLAGLVMLCWPLLMRGHDSVQPPFVFLLLLPVVVLVVVAELTHGGMDTRVLAVLGILSAINAVLRGLSAGVAGVELVFFLLVLAGRVFGPGFGFVFGCTSLFASALLTAGVGPWMPYQMLCCAWIGLGAGLLPRQVKGRAEIAMLAAYGVVVAYLYGLAMNLQGWATLTGTYGGLPGTDAPTFDPNAALITNLAAFAKFTLLTSTGSFDTIRAVTTAIAVVVLGPAVLVTLRRAARRASIVGVTAMAGSDR
ncbi:MAG: ECF transporter S component [Nocardioides sp.]